MQRCTLRSHRPVSTDHPDSDVAARPFEQLDRGRFPAFEQCRLRHSVVPPGEVQEDLYGAADGGLRPAFFQDLDTRLPEGSRVVGIDEAGHFLHLERPESVNTIIIDYLESANR